MLRWGGSIHNFRRTATQRHRDRAGSRSPRATRSSSTTSAANRDEDGVRRPAHASTSAARPTTTSTFGGGGVALLPRRQPGPARDQGHDARGRCAATRTLELAGEPRRMRSDFINGIKYMPVSSRCTADSASVPVRRRTLHAHHRSSPMQTDICDQLGIEFPIFAFTHCRDVVAAVSKAGGLRRARRGRASRPSSSRSSWTGSTSTSATSPTASTS